MKFVTMNKDKKANRNIPAFLNKLYAMVNDPQTDEFIHWNQDGTSFLVPNQLEFSKNVLPRFFKHSNFTSFIRQLNMYGFHKVPHVQQGSLLSEISPDELEFSNEHFVKNRPDLLCYALRRKNVTSDELVKDGQVDINGVLNEIASIKKHQLTISEDLVKIQRDNSQLWQESITLQEKYRAQQVTIDKIVGFLASVFSQRKHVQPGNKRRRLLLGDSLDQEDESLESMLDPNAMQQLSQLISPANAVSLSLPNGIPFLQTPNNVTPLVDALQSVQSTSSIPSISTIRPAYHDPTLPVSQDIEMLDDRLDSLSYLVGEFPADLDWNTVNTNPNLEIINKPDDKLQDFSNEEEIFDFGESGTENVKDSDLDEFFKE
jgi:heat shock transcription factor